MRVFVYVLSLIFFVPSLRLRAQERDSLMIKKDSISVLGNKKNERIRITHFILPAAMITFGFIGLESDGLKELNSSTKDEIREHNPLFNSKIDNYTQFIPGAMVFALNGLGLQGTHNCKAATLI